MFHRTLQRLLIRALCLAETTLRDSYVRQRYGATEYVREIPDPLYESSALGIHPIACLEISARPECQPEESCGRSPAEMVVLWHEVERLLGVVHGTGHIALSHGQPGTVHGDRAGEPAELPVL